MVRARWLKQWTVHLAVFASLLKAAVPMLASAAAHLQGKPVAQICDVYGVRTIVGGGHGENAAHGHHAAHEHHAGHEGGDGPASDHGSHSAATHAAGDCALTALATLAPPDDVPVAVSSVAHRTEPRAVASLVRVRDASALWAARLKQGPPALS